MRVADATADIPIELIAEQEKGGVVFLCGAGVSQRVGLPSFERLTRNVYARLHESWEGHAAEAEAMEPAFGRAIALDRALFALSKRLRGTDPASRFRAEREIIAAIEAELVPPATDLVAHGSIIRLSRDAEMRSRVVTTNFDTLFERAWPGGGALSRAGADLPAPLSTDFEGVLHLHGRIEDQELRLTRTPLVINSAEFGEAYLRAGWAARYVYDLSRAATIVIVGYGADDPPMRYILEVLTADRERYPDLKQIFAFAPCAPEPLQRDLVAAIWDAKGATAILYDSMEPADHDALYGTLTAWADFADDPGAWRRDQAERILALDPELVGEDDWARLRWMLGTGNASSLLADVNPHPRWAAPLGRAGLLSGDDASPGLWLLRRLNDPDMLSSILDGVPFEARTVALLEHALSWRDGQQDPIEPNFLKAWRLILETIAKPRTQLSMRWHRAMRSLAEGDVSLAVRRDIVQCLRPTAKPQRPFNWQGIGRDLDAVPGFRDLLRVGFGPGQVHRLGDLVSGLPADQRRAMVQALSHALDEGLEDAVEFEFSSAVSDGPSSDVRSVARHAQDRHPNGFYPIVRTIIDLWELMAADDPGEAIALSAPWRASAQLLQRRMWIHTLSTSAYDGAALEAGLAGLSDEDFWLSHARREVMRLLATRWSDLHPDVRESVERRIAAGIPDGLLSIGNMEETRSYIDHEVFKRLERIVGAGHALGPVGAAALEAIKHRYPQWTAGEGDRDDFGIWSSGVMTYRDQGDVGLLEGIGPDRLVRRAVEIADEDPMRQGEVWRLLCESEPLRALAGLLSELDAGRVEAGAWRRLFWAVADNDDLAIHAALLDAIRRRDFPAGLVHPVLDWLLRRRLLLLIDTEGLLAVWDRLFDQLVALASPITDDMREDPVFRMLNEAEGKIGTLLLNELDRRSEMGEAEALSLPLRHRIERLVNGENALRVLGRAAMMDGLRAMYRMNTAWTEAVLVPCLRWDEPLPAAACWAVLLAGNTPDAELYGTLKTDMLAAAVRPTVGRDSRNLAGWLLLPLLWRQAPVGDVYDIQPIEVRRVLARGDEDLRRSAAFWFVGAIEQLPGDKAMIWRERLMSLFVSVWPPEPALREPDSTLHLLRLALLSGDALPEAVEAIAPMLATLEPWDVSMWLEFDNEGRHRFDSHPRAMLGLLDAVIDEQGIPTELGAMLERLAAADAGIVAEPRYRKLLGWSRGKGA